MLNHSALMPPTMANRPLVSLLIFSVALLTPPLARADQTNASAVAPPATGLRLPAIFGDHMMLQREAKVPVWGWADPAEAITVTVGAVTASATADASGKWQADLQGLKASPTPIDVTVAGKAKTLTLHDVLIGDVWLCSGQSNMVLSLNADHSFKDEKPKTDDPQMRFFVMTKPKAAGQPQADCEGHWETCTQATAPIFSAAGYFFGKEIRAAEQVPVGLISSNWGGTRAQAWTSVDALTANPDLAKAFQMDQYPALRDKTVATAALHDAWMAAVGTEYLASLQTWKRASSEAAAKHEPLPPQPVPPQPEPPKAGLEGLPAGLYNGMIAPLVPFALKGVIWYQGESNAGQPDIYRVLFPAMIADWRTHFGQDFPFIFVQLPNWQSPALPNTIYSWPPLREAQLMTLTATPNTAMAIAIDLGNPANIHPIDKRDVGHRLALAARRLAYGEKLVASGPLYDSIKVDGNKIAVKFKETGSGLKIGTPPPEELEMFPITPTTTLNGFAVAGADMKFSPATATIDGTDTVTVTSNDVPQPVAVRYDWDDNPTPVGNLYNHEDLPAAPFRTDSFPLSTERAPRPAAPPSTNAAPTNPLPSAAR